MTTALGLITSAMKKIGVLTKSETPDSDESADGLVALNNLLSSWSNESLFVYARTWENFNLVAGTATYTIGTSQTFNTVRPILLVESHIRINSTDYHLTQIPDESYNAMPDKLTQGIPEFINYDNGFAAGTLRLFPVPNSAYVLYILSEKQLVTLALGDTVTLPPGWERALIANLAIEMAPEYGVQVDPLLISTAKEAKGLIALTISKNRPVPPVNSYGFRYNYLTDGY